MPNLVKSYFKYETELNINFRKSDTGVMFLCFRKSKLINLYEHT